MLRFSALVAVSALMLAACSQSGNSQPSTSSSQTSTQKTTAAGSACRSMGEGHKVNGKGQNDIYMCKVDVALNSAEAKSALDPSIRVHYGSTSGATLTSRQIHPRSLRQHIRRDFDFPSNLQLSRQNP